MNSSSETDPNGTVDEYAKSPVETIEASATVLEAAKRLTQGSRGQLAVMDAGRLVGIIAPRDIVVKVLAEDKDPGSTQVGTIATPKVESVRLDQDARTAFELVKETTLDRIVVVDDGGRPVGTVSAAQMIQSRFVKWHRV